MDVLVITARPALWEALRPAFEAHGASLRFAPDLEQGRDVVRASRPDLALLDLD